MSRKKDPRYAHYDLPPVKNFFAYSAGCLLKILIIAFFGVGGFSLSVFIFPFIKMKYKDNFTLKARDFVKSSFWWFINFMQKSKLSFFSYTGLENLASCKSKIIVANHPSLIDVIYIIAAVPNADCIVRGGLMHSPLAGVIRKLYIVNTLGVDEMLEKSAESLKKGANLIIFPEGTRTPRHGKNPYKRGAARIAVQTGCDIIPIYIGGNDKYGLGKHDPFFSYNRSEAYHYDIHVLDEIKINDYKIYEAQIATRRITAELYSRIAKKALEIDGRSL